MCTTVRNTLVKLTIKIAGDTLNKSRNTWKCSKLPISKLSAKKRRQQDLFHFAVMVPHNYVLVPCTLLLLIFLYLFYLL